MTRPADPATAFADVLTGAGTDSTTTAADPASDPAAAFDDWLTERLQPDAGTEPPEPPGPRAPQPNPHQGQGGAGPTAVDPAAEFASMIESALGSGANYMPGGVPRDQIGRYAGWRDPFAGGQRVPGRS